MRIVGYENTENVTVEFLDMHKFRKTTAYVNIKSGGVKNPYDRTVRGIGYLGDGKYKTNRTLHERRAFGIWCGIIDRCYNETYRDKYSAYKGCLICDEWQCYQTFREWYDSEFYTVGTERTHIDKDILYKNNKIYSPKTCLLVPQRINMLFSHKPNKHNLPNGVRLSTSNQFEAFYAGKKIGNFNSVEEAAVAHDKAKKQAINRVAIEYKDKIPQKVYEALVNWIPDYVEY